MSRDSSSEASAAPIGSSSLIQRGGTVKEYFESCMTVYEKHILDSTLPSTAPAFQQVLASLLADLSSMWHRFEAAGVLSVNDEIDDLSTSTIAMLITPYVVADLQQRVVQGESDSTKQRVMSLTVSLYYFHQFLQAMVQIGLVTEKEVELGTRYSSADRTRRVENSRKLTEINNKIRAIDDKIRFLSARSRRMAQLCAEDGDTYEEKGGEEEETLRERALLRLQWGILESFQHVQMSTRELEMLDSLSTEQRNEIVRNYQRNMEEGRESGGLGLAKNTYTVLPGGLIAPGHVGIKKAAGNPDNDVFYSNAMTMSQQQQLAACGIVYREQVRSEVFIERNVPTMTLAEFAASEMAEIERQMRVQTEGQKLQQEEDDRLGADGIEERERQKDTYWADWKDDNPPIGITTKGNYS